jgi:CBS domain-containing protein
MTTVNGLLSAKGHDISTIDPDSPVADALAKMADENIGSLLVMDAGRLIGIFTERHYARNAARSDVAPSAIRVRDIMRDKVIVTRPDQTIEECMAVMTQCRVRHLPVLAGDEVVGIVSIGDLLKHVIGDQKFALDQLVDYIHG